MHDIEKTIIPLDDAYEILSVFGISPYSCTYRRCCRDDGFRQMELEDVLNECPSILGVDWRGWLRETVEVIVQQLACLGIDVQADFDENGNEARLHLGGKAIDVKYVPSDDDDFDDVMAQVNQLIAPKARYRRFRSTEGSDGWAYALLSNENWRSLQSVAGQSVDLLFSDVDPKV